MPVPDIVHEFREYFYSLVQQIPEGMVTNYGTLAEALGDQRAARAVGKMLNENPRPIEVPCHRVVRHDGHIGGFATGIENKIELLKEEGVDVKNNHVVNFQKKLFTDFDAEPVLNELKTNQKELKKKVSIRNNNDIETVGGVDASFGENKAYASLSIFKDGDEIDNITVSKKITFPYIPTYLSYRELPLLLELMNETDNTPDVILVDGNGILHPRGFGLASHFGVEADVPTIGVAKSKLLGTVVKEPTQDDPIQEIKINDNMAGYAFLSSKRAKNPIYVSPGHKVSYNTSINIVEKHCEYKVPNPIRKAHMTANKMRREG